MDLYCLLSFDKKYLLQNIVRLCKDIYFFKELYVEFGLLDKR